MKVVDVVNVAWPDRHYVPRWLFFFFLIAVEGTVTSK